MSDFDEKSSLSIRFNNQDLLITHTGALFWPSQKLLVIADLHLEKGSYFAEKGNPLPLYDTKDILQRLQQLVDRWQPHKIISLGDNIHDVDAFQRMAKSNQDDLYRLIASVEEWIWLAGNHDKDRLPEKVDNLFFHDTFTLEGITFSHDFLQNIPYQIIGHYHPKAKIKNMRGRCFLVNEHKIIMPSFGSYTGGLDIDSLTFKEIMQPEKFKAYLLYREKVWQIR